MKRTHDQSHSSLADIAMLLLIFFLITTQFPKEEGVKATLPPLSQHEQVSKDLQEIDIWLNDQDLVMINNAFREPNDVSTILFDFLTQQDKQIQVNLTSHENASYPAYVGIYDQIKSAYKEVYNYEALKLHGMEFDQLPAKSQSEIASKLPIKIFEGDLIR